MSDTPTADVTFAEAIRCALEDAMREDESIVLLGQDIASGFPFGATRELAASFGDERVRDTPISEAATMGCGIGAAMMGVRTVVEVDFAGFLLLGLDQLVNNAAKLRYMSGGQLRVPLLVRVGQGPLGAFAAQHSQAQHAWLASVPGLALCAPSDAQDAYTQLRWALRQRDPVVFAEDMRLYRRKGPLVRDLAGAGVSRAGDSHLPAAPAAAGDATHNGVPLARVLRPGRDATVLCFGFGTALALAAATDLAGEGVELEIVDLRLLSPLDGQTIGESSRHTGRVLCLGDDPLLGGITATLAATVDHVAHGAVVGRLGARHWPTPFGSAEAFVYPAQESVAGAVRQLLAWPAAGEAQIAHGDFQLAGAQVRPDTQVRPAREREP
ncbi:MAG TPA: transketolase C-terminal domain-containing protein [Solirubrobacteraceae bacterium]|nr:transketolase C-terminal domain-containing protein [Solirubrobacteraceae bacterium]